MFKKNTILSGVIYLILLGIYNLLVFMIFTEKNAVFWWSYGFMTFAFLVQMASVFLSFMDLKIDAIFFGIPLVSFSIYYFLAELFMSTVFMIFNSVGFKVAFTMQMILLALYVVVAIVSIMARDTVREVSNHVKEKVMSLKVLNVDVDMMLASCTDSELKISLRKLSETIKYSDPMTNSHVEDLDNLIRVKVSEMSLMCKDNQIDSAKTLCNDIERMFIERNNKLLVSK